MKNKKASVLVYSLIILSIALISALSISAVTLSNRKSSLSTSKSTQSFQIADTGVELVLREIYKGSHTDLESLASAISANCDNGVITGTYGGNTYRVTFLNAAGTQLSNCGAATWRDEVASIKSEGIAGNTSRVIETAIAAAGGSGIAGGCTVCYNNCSSYSVPFGNIDGRWGVGCKTSGVSSAGNCSGANDTGYSCGIASRTSDLNFCMCVSN